MRTDSSRIPLYLRWLGSFLLLFFSSGCSGISVQEYQDEKPTLSVEAYFSGNLEAVGIVADRSGRVVKRFTCAMHGTWSGSELILNEDFTWSDGSKQQRVWRLVKQPDGSFVGSAGDVVGTARAEAAGNAFHLVYDLEVPVDGSTTVLHVDDWLYLVTDSVIINHSRLTKFGLDAAEVILTIRKL